jgi:glutaredoxin 3
MRRITIYTTPMCPYCVRAKALLRNKGADFEEVDVLMNCEARAQMEQKSGRSTVPQIFIDDMSIGGCDDLAALEFSGKLDSLLES